MVWAASTSKAATFRYTFGSRLQSISQGPSLFCSKGEGMDRLAGLIIDCFFLLADHGWAVFNFRYETDGVMGERDRATGIASSICCCMSTNPGFQPELLCIS